MRICVLSEYFYPDSTGGSGTVLSNLVRRLKDEYKDLEIDVITSNNLFRGEAQSLPAYEDWDGVRIRRLSAPQPRKRSIRRRLSANMAFTSNVLCTLIQQRGKYDLIMVSTAPLTPTLAPAARAFRRLTGTPYLYLIYDLYLDLALALSMVGGESNLVRSMQKVQRSWLLSSSKVIVLGRCMRDLISDRYRVPHEHIEVVPIPSDISRIQPQSSQTQFRTEHGLSGFVVLYAGNFAQYQDFDTLLDAANILKGRSDITWVFVGDGAKMGHILGRVEGESMANVRVLPFVPQEELSDMLASADVSLVTLERGTAGLAVPSKFYNFLASGRPTVAVIEPFSEITRAINDFGCGLCVEPEDSAGLANAFTRLAQEPDEARRMGQVAREACEAHYAVPHIAHRFHEIFQEVACPQSRKSHSQNKAPRSYKDKGQRSKEKAEPVTSPATIE
jgi:glycosyltransferase involved in cell wall biosynthesis